MAGEEQARADGSIVWCGSIRVWISVEDTVTVPNSEECEADRQNSVPRPACLVPPPLLKTDQRCSRGRNDQSDSVHHHRVRTAGTHRADDARRKLAAATASTTTTTAVADSVVAGGGSGAGKEAVEEEDAIYSLSLPTDRHPLRECHPYIAAYAATITLEFDNDWQPPPPAAPSTPSSAR